MSTVADKIAFALQSEQADLERMRDTHKRDEQAALDRIQRLKKCESCLKDSKVQQAIDLLVEIGWVQE